MITLDSVQRVKQTKPPRMVIYGPPGVGKTSLAAEFPSPVFIQTEDGISSDLELDTFGKMECWEDVFEALRSLATPQHDYRTVVIDSLDKLEPLIWAHICHERNWESIESPGYGKGYVEADAIWYKLFSGLDYLRENISMSVVLIAHSAIVSYPNPAGAEFPRWDIRLQKRAHGIVEDSVDAILMLDFDNSTREVSGKGGAKTTKSTGSTMRYIHCVGSPARNAKNRYSLPDKIMYTRGEAFTKLAGYFPGMAAHSLSTESE